jgi:hypothetical protein
VSTKGLFNVPAESPDMQFAFIVNGVRYECLWAAAEFLSPCVSYLHSTDATADELTDDVDDPENFLLNPGSRLRALRHDWQVQL